MKVLIVVVGVVVRVLYVGVVSLLRVLLWLEFVIWKLFVVVLGSVVVVVNVYVGY